MSDIDETLEANKIGFARNILELKQKISPFAFSHCFVYNGSSLSSWAWDDYSSDEESDTIIKSSKKKDGRWVNDGTYQKTISSTSSFSGLKVLPGTMITIPGEDGGIFYAVESGDSPDGSTTFATATSGVVMKKFPTGDNSISGLIDNITNVSYVLSPSAQANGKIKGVVAVVDNGVLDLSVEINGNPVTGIDSISVSSTVQTTTLEIPVSFSLADQISITPSNIATAQRLSFIIQIA